MKSEQEEYLGDMDEEVIGRRLLITATAASLLIVGLILAWLGIGKGLEGIFFGLALAIATAPQLWDAIERFRKNPFNADLLMCVAAVGAAVGAAAIGVWKEGAAVLILYNVAENIEDYRGGQGCRLEGAE